MTISLESVLGVLATLSLITLLGSVVALIFSEKMLRRSKVMLDFAFFIAARQDEWNTLLDGDESNHEALNYHEGYRKGYADGAYGGMKRFMQEQEESDEQASTSEASGV